MAKNRNPANDPQIINIEDILNKPVADGTVQDATFFEIDPDDVISDAVFEEPEPEIVEEPTAEPVTDTNCMPADALAEVIVNSLDGIQIMTLPELRYLKKFTKKERETIANLGAGTMYSANSAEAKLMKRYDRHLQIVEQIPFNPGEQKRLKASLKTVIKASNVKVSPLQAALMSIGEVMIKRASLFFTD